MKLFESMLWTKEKGYFLLEYHLERIEKSAVHFGFHFREDAALDKLKQLGEELADCSGGSCKVKMILDASGEIEFEKEDTALRAPKGPLRLAIASQRIDPDDTYIRHKTTRRDFYDRAVPAVSVEYDDLIFLNTRGEVCETTRANIVIRSGKDYLTPPVSCGLLPGTFRAYLLDREKIRNAILYEKDLLSADALYCINSVRTWMDGVLVSS